MNIDLNDFRCNYTSYYIAVPASASEDGTEQTISLKRWILIQFENPSNHFLLDEGSWGGSAWTLRVDDDGSCYTRKSSDEWLYLGTLHKIPA